MAAPAQDELAAKLTDFLTRRLRLRFDGTPGPVHGLVSRKGPGPAGGRRPELLRPGRAPLGAHPERSQGGDLLRVARLPPGPPHLAKHAGGAPVEEVLVPGAESHPYPAGGPQPPTRPPAETAWRFLTLGFTHILPKGLDHILFVLGLALLSPRPRPLLAQITAFTLAHTLTLGLSTYGVVRLSLAGGRALDRALDRLRGRREPAHHEAPGLSRVVLVFAFGLLHGLGFAGVLGELGWPQGRRLLALLAFNAGVEAGQVTVVALALLVVAGWARAGGDRLRLVRGASIAIAAVGAFWAVSRVVAP